MRLGEITKMCTKPTVFVVDEDASIRGSVADLAGTMGLRCKTYANGLDFLDDRDEAVPGCIVTETRMMAIGGLQIQRRLLGAGDPLSVIFLAAQADVATVVRAMRDGAAHFLQKPYSSQELWDTIQEAVQLSQTRLRVLRKRRELEGRIASLTPRERQVLEMVGLEKPNRLIAAELRVGVRTVEIHRAKLMAKLEIKSPMALMRIAAQVSQGHANSNGTSDHLDRMELEAMSPHA